MELGVCCRSCMWTFIYDQVNLSTVNDALTSMNAFKKKCRTHKKQEWFSISVLFSWIFFSKWMRWIKPHWSKTNPNRNIISRTFFTWPHSYIMDNLKPRSFLIFWFYVVLCNSMICFNSLSKGQLILTLLWQCTHQNSIMPRLNFCLITMYVTWIDLLIF